MNIQEKIEKLRRLATDNPTTPEQLAAKSQADKLEKKYGKKFYSGPIYQLPGKVIKVPLNWRKFIPKVVRRVEVPYSILRLIPNHSVLNTTLHTLERSFYEMMTVKFPKYPWQHREGFHILLRARPDFWWVMNMAQDEGIRRIEFYMAVPSDMVSSFKMKISNHRQWSGCTIEDVDPEEFEFPVADGNTDLYKMEYLRHDMFSLRFKLPEETTPILELMNLSNELYDDESISIFIRNENVPRMKWRKLADFAWKHWDNGGILHRNSLDLRRAMEAVVSFARTGIHEAGTVLAETVNAIRGQFFFIKGDTEIIKIKRLSGHIARERALLLVNGKLSDKTFDKRNLPAFKSSQRIAIRSRERVRRQILAKGIESSYANMNGDNELKMIKINIRAKKELEDLSQWKLNDPAPNVMSVDEVSKLMQLPTRQLQEIFHDALEYNEKIEVDIPKAFLDDSGLYSGTTEVKGEEHKIHWPMKDKDMRHTCRVFIGSPRMGKDMDCVNFIVEGKRKFGIGAVVPDVIDERNGHRGMADALRDHLPAEDIIDINLGDFDWPVYLGLNSLTSETDNDRIKSNLIAQYLTSFLMGDDVENHRTREYMREFAKAVKGDLIDMKLMCLSKKFRGAKIEELKELGWDTLALEGFHKLKSGQDAIVGPILVRLGELLGDEFLKPIFGQQMNPDINLTKWMQEGKVVIFRIPSRKLGEMAVQIITYWIVLLTFLTGLALDGKDSPGSFLVLNEPHQFLSKGLIHFTKRLLLEGPKYHVTPIFIYHTPDVTRMMRELHNVILSASVNWHIFKNTNVKIYEELKHVISPTYTPEEAMTQTERLHFIAGWLNDKGQYETPFMVKAPDLVWERYPTEDNSHLTKEHSKKYGKHIDSVLKDLQDRQRVIYESDDDEEEEGQPIKSKGATKKRTR